MRRGASDALAAQGLFQAPGTLFGNSTARPQCRHCFLTAFNSEGGCHGLGDLIPGDDNNDDSSHSEGGASSYTIGGSLGGSDNVLGSMRPQVASEPDYTAGFMYWGIMASGPFSPYTLTAPGRISW